LLKISPVKDTKNNFNCTLACELRVLKAKLRSCMQNQLYMGNSGKVSELQLGAAAAHPAAG